MSCCKSTCSNCFSKFEPQQFPPYYDDDPNSVIKRKIQPLPPRKESVSNQPKSPKIVLVYEKYDLRKI